VACCELGYLIGIDSIQSSVVKLGGDLAVADGQENDIAGHACPADRLWHRDSFAHDSTLPLAAETIVESLANEVIRLLKLGAARQGIRLVCQLDGLVQHPEDLRDL